MRIIMGILTMLCALIGCNAQNEGFKAKFSDFKVKHLPDQRRVEWLKNNQ